MEALHRSPPSQDRILRVLKLLECLTYGITITWQEPYLKDLIKALVNFITGENVIHLKYIAHATEQSIFARQHNFFHSLFIKIPHRKF